jgi:hypothetical protein
MNKYEEAAACLREADEGEGCPLADVARCLEELIDLASVRTPVDPDAEAKRALHDRQQANAARQYHTRNFKSY